MTTPKVPLFRNSEQDDEARRQSREYVLVQIEKYSALDVDTLGKHIAQSLLLHKEDLIVDFIHLFQWFVRVVRVRLLRQKPARVLVYPKVYDGNSLFVNYINDVQRALCEKGWLCRIMAVDSSLSDAEQIEKIAHYLRNHSRVQRWSGRVEWVPVAILITKIGARHFCGCSAVKPPKN